MKTPLHPLTMWIAAAIFAFTVIATDDVKIAVVLVGVAGIFVFLRRDGSPWSKSFLLALQIGAVIVFIRALIGITIGVPIPGREIFRLPLIDLPSWMPGIRLGGVVTYERFSSALHEGLIIAAIIALIGAATSLTSPHRLMKSLPLFIYEVGVTLVIATSLFPQLATSLKRIHKAQKLRGIERIGVRTLLIPLFEESLSRSLHLAESMDARGFGVSRKRSRYRAPQWRFSDGLYLLGTLLITTLAWSA